MLILHDLSIDYICNWFGGEAVSLALNHTHATEFREAGYAPFIVGGQEMGEVRQAGNFSFLRIYEAGHEVPFCLSPDALRSVKQMLIWVLDTDQPEASLAMFQRVIEHKDIATGEEAVTANLTTNGTAKATHTEPFVALPSQTANGTSKSSAGRIPFAA